MWRVEAVSCASEITSPLYLIAQFSPFKANPDYKGKWYAPMIDNPEYKGEWAPKKIPNPDFFEDLTPVKNLVKIVRVFFSVSMSTSSP